jgi:hypothetical protein
MLPQRPIKAILEDIVPLNQQQREAKGELEACINELMLEADECARLRESMADKLTRTANALKGPPPPDTLHSWHDLPEVAAKALAPVSTLEIDRLKKRLLVGERVIYEIARELIAMRGHRR